MAFDKLLKYIYKICDVINESLPLYLIETFWTCFLRELVQKRFVKFRNVTGLW